MHVPADEGFGIGLEQADQHLFQGYPFVTGLAGDLAEGIAGLDLAGRTSGRWGGRRFSRPGLAIAPGWRPRGFVSPGRGFSPTAANSFDRLRLGHRHRLPGSCHGNFGWIEEESVFANQSARRPVQLDKKIEEGLVDRLGRGDPNDRLSVGPPINGKFEIQQPRRELDARLTKRVHRRQTGCHSDEFVPGAAEFDLGTKRLTQPGKDRDLTESGRRRNAGQQGQTGGHGSNRGAHLELSSEIFCHGATLSVEIGLLK